MTRIDARVEQSDPDARSVEPRMPIPTRRPLCTPNASVSNAAAGTAADTPPEPGTRRQPRDRAPARRGASGRPTPRSRSGRGGTSAPGEPASHATRDLRSRAVAPPPRPTSRRIWFVAVPPARRTRSATDGARSTTTHRPPSSGAGLDPRRPSHPDATSGASVAPLAPPATSREATASTAATQLGQRTARGVRIERKVAGETAGAYRAADATMAALSVRRGRAERSEPRQCPSQLGVRRDTADDGERLRPVCSTRRGAPDERLHDRPLVRRGEIRPAPFEPRLGQLADGVEQRGLGLRTRSSPGRGPRGTRTRPGRRRARADRSQPHRVAEPSSLAPCRTPRRVVERRPEQLEALPVTHRQHERVPPAREQARERRVERVGREVQGRHVGAEVVDRDERQATRPRERLRGGEADEQGADEARPCVTPIRSTSSRATSASSTAARMTGATSSRCRREAISGTTPP